MSRWTFERSSVAPMEQSVFDSERTKKSSADLILSPESMGDRSLSTSFAMIEKMRVVEHSLLGLLTTHLSECFLHGAGSTYHLNLFLKKAQ